MCEPYGVSGRGPSPDGRAETRIGDVALTAILRVSVWMALADERIPSSELHWTRRSRM